MYYKTKKISNLSSVFQVNLFRHYRRLLAPLNPTFTFFHNWLTLVSLIVLGYALLQSTFVIFGLSLLWLILPITKTLLWYTPISLSFWIFSISLLTSIHSLKLCFSLPKEFRAVLLIEQGLSIKTFLSKSYNTLKKIGLLLLLILVFFYLCPRFMIALIWAMPLFIEFYLLSGVTNAFLTKNLMTMPSQTLATFLGFEYNYLQSNPKTFFFFADDFYDNWVDEELEDEEESVGEEDEDEEFSDHFGEGTFDDFEIDDDDVEDNIDNHYLGYAFDRPLDAHMQEILLIRRRLFKYHIKTLKEMENQDLTILRKNFPEFFQLQEISLDLKYQYQKVPLLYNYLKAKKETAESIPFKKELTQYSQYLPIEKRLWKNSSLNVDVLRLPTSSPWYNSGFPQLFDDMFSDYEDLSDFIHESPAAAEDGLDTDPDPEYESNFSEIHDFNLYGQQEEVFDEPGSGDEYKAPNWFLLSFCYYTIFFWAFLNCFLFLFFCICGIPESWFLTYRSAASQNVLLYKTLLNMTEQLYTKWGFTKLPVGGYSRIEYFNYMQPSYFTRLPKLYKKYTTFKSGNKFHPWGWWYWGRTYKHWNVYGINQGPSRFSKNVKFSTFDTYLTRKHSSILFINRMRLNQNLGLQYINSEFFAKKDHQVFEFYNIMEKVQKK